jgi:peptidyl-prolyl cis-trans isomerase B (cyclophilin B)
MPRLCVPVCISLLLLACGGEPASPQMPEASEPEALTPIGPGPHDVAVLDMGKLGVVRIELYPELAPKSVELFTKLADEGFYDGTYFHRVLPGFMIQGGDPNTRNNDPRDDGKGGTSFSIPDEFSDYPHVRGTVSMANTGYRNSAGSQFFIVQQDSPGLDGDYTVIGRVVEGMETVDAIAALEIDVYGRYGPRDRPYPVSATIESARVERADAASVAAADPPAKATGK